MELRDLNYMQDNKPGEIPIIKITPLKHTRNPYLRDDQVYFDKRRNNLIDAKISSHII